MLGADTDVELRRVVSNAAELEARAKAAGVELVIPFQSRLDDLGAAMAAFPPDAIREGLKVRDGLAYQTLKDRGVLVKRNFENRLEIAKLSLLVSRMGADERSVLGAAVRSGAIAEPLKAETLDEPSAAMAARFLRRCGIGCAAEGRSIVPSEEPGGAEVRIKVANRSVWVAESSREKLEGNLKEMEDLNAHIQLKNAERQIKEFSEEEEEHFASLQRQYLGLLKQQDEILGEFDREEAAASSRS